MKAGFEVEFGIIVGMKSFLISFFSEWEIVISCLASVVSALGSLVAAIGAVYAVRQIRKRWKQDDPIATAIIDHETLHRKEGDSLAFRIRIVNVGKAPFVTHRLAFIDQRNEDAFKIVVVPAFQQYLEQGAYTEEWATVLAKEQGVAIPERLGIAVLTPSGIQVCKVVIKTPQPSPA